MPKAILLSAVLLLGCATSPPPARMVRSAPAEPYRPPADAHRCPDGIGEFAVEWQIIKADEPSQPALVTVFLNAAQTCRVLVGALPRHCAFQEDRLAVTCAERDGSAAHRVRVVRTSDGAEVWVDAPAGAVLVASVRM